MMASYLNPHPKTGWRYQRAIPKDLRPLLGGRKVSVKYIPAMSQRDAEKQARAYAVADDERWSKLRGLSPKEAKVVSFWGIDRLGDVLPTLEWKIAAAKQDQVALRDEIRTNKNDPATIESVNRQIQELEARKTYLLGLLREQQELFENLTEDSSGFSLDDLFNLWVKVKEPKTTRKHASKMQLFKSVIGDVDYRTVTQAEAAKFRDHLATMDIEKPSQHNYLTVVRAMFSAAVSENKIPSNPISGITVHGKRPNGKAHEDRPFTGAEERLILERAAETKFGGNRHEDVMWVLKLLAWTGARPNEIAQLRKCDVYVEFGVPLIHIREGHPFQSVKTSDSRKIPLLPAVADFVAYAKKANDDFVFSSFSRNSCNGRAAWFMKNFRKLLNEKCDITGDRRKTLYSFRHRFADATRDPRTGVSVEISKYLMGHSTGDVHGKYGRGVGLRQMAEAMAELNPLAD